MGERVPGEDADGNRRARVTVDADGFGPLGRDGLVEARERALVAAVERVRALEETGRALVEAVARLREGLERAGVEVGAPPSCYPETKAPRTR